MDAAVSPGAVPLDEQIEAQLRGVQEAPSTGSAYEHLEREEEDEDPSAGSGRGGRLNRTTIMIIFGIATFVGSVAMAVILFHFVNGNTPRAHSAGIADTHAPSSDASMNGAAQDMQTAQRALTDDDGTSGAGGSGSGNSGNGGTGNAGGTGDNPGTDTRGAGGTSDTATPTPSPAELAAQERAQHQLDELKARDQLASQAFSAEAMVMTGDSTQQGQVGGGGDQLRATDPTPTPPSDPAGLAARAVARRYVVRGTDFITGLIVPATNAERGGPVKIVLSQPLTDTATHLITLIPMGATIQAQLDVATINSSRIGLIAARVQYQRYGPWVDLGQAIVGDPDGTLGVSAKIDRHLNRVLSISAIGGALAGLAQGAYGGVTISPSGGVSATSTNPLQQMAGGAGAGVLQSAGSMAQQASALAPTLTTVEAKPVTIIINDDIALEPYCDPEVPNSLECQVKEYLNEAAP